MATWQLPAELILWITQLSQPLHGRLAWRLLPLMTGMLFAQGRRTVASWLRGGGLGHDFRRYYYFLGSLGHNVKYVAGVLLHRAVEVIQPGERLLFALDDTPTPCYGPHVEGAGIHHQPTPGPTDLNLWLHTLIELWAWGQSHQQWCDRRQSPWDDAERRPSHADRRNALRRSCLGAEILAAGRRRHLAPKFKALLRRLLRLVA